MTEPTKPDWCPQITWDQLADDVKQFCIDSPEQARGIVTKSHSETAATVEATRERRPDDVKQLLASLGEKVTDDLRQSISVEVDAGEEYRQVRIRNWSKFQKAYGPMLEALPDSGAMRKEGSNTPFDIFTVSRPRKRGGDPVVEEFSVLDALHDEFIAKDLTDAIVELEKQNTDQAQGKSIKVETELARKRSRRSMGRKYVHEAVSFGKQWARFTTLKWVGLRFNPRFDLEAGQGTLNQDGSVNLANVSKGPDCLMLFRKLPDGGETDHRKLSVGTFLKYRLDIAAEKAGGMEKVTLDNVIESAPKKKTGAKTADETGADDNDVVIQNVAQFESAVAELAFLKDDEKFLGNLYTYLNKRDAKGDYVNDDALASVFAAAALFDEITSKPDLQARYKKFAATQKAAA